MFWSLTGGKELVWIAHMHFHLIWHHSKKKQCYSCTNWYERLLERSVQVSVWATLKGNFIVPSDWSVFGEGCRFPFRTNCWSSIYFIISRQRPKKIPCGKTKTWGFVWRERREKNNLGLWCIMGSFFPGYSESLTDPDADYSQRCYWLRLVTARLVQVNVQCMKPTWW